MFRCHLRLPQGDLHRNLNFTKMQYRGDSHKDVTTSHTETTAMTVVRQKYSRCSYEKEKIQHNVKLFTTIHENKEKVWYVTVLMHYFLKRLNHF
jgi:hypothetical protein